VHLICTGTVLVPVLNAGTRPNCQLPATHHRACLSRRTGGGVCKWYVLGPHWIPEQLAHPGHCHTPWRAFAKG
jgi:hypothetical protein